MRFLAALSAAALIASAALAQSFTPGIPQPGTGTGVIVGATGATLTSPTINTPAISSPVITGSGTTIASPSIASPTVTGTETNNGAITGTAFSNFIAANLLSPGPIGGTAPNTGSFSSLTDTALAGTGSRCVDVSSAGQFAVVAGDCGTGALAAIAANTVLVNPTGSSAVPVATTIPSCSTTSSVLQYTTSGGASSAISCNNAINAATVNGNTFTSTGSTFTGTSGQTYTFPTTSQTIATWGAPNAFTSTNTYINSTTYNSGVRVGTNGYLSLGTTTYVLAASASSPTINSGSFGTSPTLTAGAGTFTFTVTVGSGGTSSSGTINMPIAANHGWLCQVNDQTARSGAAQPNVAFTMETSNSTTSVTVGNFTDTMAVGPWNAGDVLQFMCIGD